jgi:hypothetical protein
MAVNFLIPVWLLSITFYIGRIIMLVTFVRFVQTKVIFKVLWGGFILFLTRYFIIVRIIMYFKHRKTPAPETES